DYIFGLDGNAALDALVAGIADNLRFHHAKSSQTKLRTYASFTYQAGSWTRSRKVVARLECSLQPDTGGTTSTGMRQEVDIRYVVTSLKGSAQHLYENVYCPRGQMENLIKLNKAQLASDRMSCHSAIANQVRLVFHTAAYWLMHRVRAAIPPAHPLARAEFATIRERLIKIAARVIEHVARIRIQLPTSCPDGALFRTVALGLMRSGPWTAGQWAPRRRRSRQIKSPRVAQRVDAHRSRPDGSTACACGTREHRACKKPACGE